MLQLIATMIVIFSGGVQSDCTQGTFVLFEDMSVVTIQSDRASFVCDYEIVDNTIYITEYRYSGAYEYALTYSYTESTRFPEDVSLIVTQTLTHAAQ